MKVNSLLCLLLTIMPISGFCFSETIADYIADGINVQFIALHDPGVIALKLESGKIIQTSYSGIEFRTLDLWEGNNRLKNRFSLLKIFYSLANGITVKDPKSELQFSLYGSLSVHPIDIALENCLNKDNSNYGSESCQQLELEAWDAELNRAYRLLGGSQNPKLKASQLAWIKFRDVQIEYLQSDYGNRNGTIWGSVYMRHVVSMTRQQAKRLISINEW